MEGCLLFRGAGGLCSAVPRRTFTPHFYGESVECGIRHMSVIGRWSRRERGRRNVEGIDEVIGGGWIQKVSGKKSTQCDNRNAIALS